MENFTPQKLNPQEIEIHLKDDRGDILIYKRDNIYFLMIEMEGPGGNFWEESGRYTTLAQAVHNMTDCLICNVQNHFYDED